MRKLMTMLLTALAIIPAMAYDVETTDHLRVWAEFPDPVVADGKTVNYVKVYQHDSDDLDYTAFNLELILPEGFRVNKVRQGRDMVNDIFFTDRATTTHSISCNLLNGVDLRIIGDSSENANLYKDDVDGNPLDHLFTVGLIAEPTLASGEYQVEMKGVVFVHRTGDARVPALDDPSYYTVTIDNPGSTAIEEVEADSLDPEECYDLMGRKVDPRKVHDMIVVSKGKKVYVK